MLEKWVKKLVRTNYKIQDVWENFYKLFSQFATDTAPWWDVIKGWPESEVFDQGKNFIYTEPPKVVGVIGQQGGVFGSNMNMLIGIWVDRQRGGIEESNIMASCLLDLFNNPNALHSKQYDVTLGLTDYENTTLLAQGIHVDVGLIGPRDINIPDLTDFRQEFEINLRIN